MAGQRLRCHSLHRPLLRQPPIEEDRLHVGRVDEAIGVQLPGEQPTAQILFDDRIDAAQAAAIDVDRHGDTSIVDTETDAIGFDKNQGPVIGYAHVFSDKLRGNIATGFNGGKTAQTVDNRTLEEALFNLIYSPVKEVDLGGEWIYGSRRTFADGTGTLSRFDLMARYSF